MDESQGIRLARRARERAIRQGDQSLIARLERVIYREAAEEESRVAAVVADWTRTEAMRRLAGLA